MNSQCKPDAHVFYPQTLDIKQAEPQVLKCECGQREASAAPRTNGPGLLIQFPSPLWKLGAKS